MSGLNKLIKIKKYVYTLLYFIFGAMIVCPTNFHIYDYEFWVMAIGGVGLYAVGRYEALYEKEQ